MRIFVVFSVLVLCIACSKNEISPDQLGEKFSLEHYPQKWELVEMSSNWSNASPLTGDEMDWQEFYLLNSDGTFVKKRNQQDMEAQEDGTYTFVSLSDGVYLELNYEKENGLIANCTSELKEMLKLNSEGVLKGIWSACDGPGLVYNRTE